MKNISSSLIAGGLMLAAASAHANVVTLTFEGVGNDAQILNYYDGGTDSYGDVGPDYGVTFGSAALGLVASSAGGSGNFGGNPSGDTILFFLNGDAILDYAAGFTTGFSFYYSAIFDPGYISVYSGLDDTGTLLASLTLPTTPYDPTPGMNFDPFVPIGVAFSGTAESIDFGGTVDQIGFDNVTFGSVTATPGTPSPAAVLPFVGGLIAVARRRRSA